VFPNSGYLDATQNMVDIDIEKEAEKASQGKVTGVIIPPPEIRAVVDKTAQFVGKNGKSFEQRILSSAEGKTAKFNFMRDFDPYHAYYELKIR
jgi:splicing factor 3A subunit 1